MIGWFLVKFFCNPALVGPSLFLVVLFGTLHTCCVPRCAISLAQVYNITSLLIKKKKCRQKSSIVCNMLLAMAKYVCFCCIDYALNLALDFQEKGKQAICLAEPRKCLKLLQFCWRNHVCYVLLSYFFQHFPSLWFLNFIKFLYQS